MILAGYNLPNWLMSDLLTYIGNEDQPTINISFINQVRARHGKLVDKKYLVGLDGRETIELIQINHILDAAEAKYYAPIKAELARLNLEIEN
jgi:hypothetical protein